MEKKSRAEEYLLFWIPDTKWIVFYLIDFGVYHSPVAQHNTYIN